MTFTATPQTVFFAHVLRMVGEAKPTPRYTSETGVTTPTERFLIAEAEMAGVTEDFCFVCSRCTDHRGEHSPAQLLHFARSPRGARMLEWNKD